MAKPKDDAAYQKWLNEEFLPSVEEGKRDAVLAALAENEKAHGAFLRHSDYTVKTQELAKVRKEAEAVLDKARKVDAYDAWYLQHAKPTFDKVTSENERLKQALIAGGSLEDGDDPPASGAARGSAPSEAQLKKLEELEARVAQVDTGAFNTMVAMTNLLRRAQKEGIEFDAAEVLGHASRNGISPILAYEELTREQREERQRKDFEDKLKQAREEGRREALSKVHSPDYAGEQETVPTVEALFGPSQKAQSTTPVADEQARVAEALRVFREAGETAS